VSVDGQRERHRRVEVGPGDVADAGDSDGQRQAVGHGHRQGPVGGVGHRPGQGRRDGGAGDGQDQHERADRLSHGRPGQVAVKLVAVQEHGRAAAGRPLP
jgi:hypothetical protein